MLENSSGPIQRTELYVGEDIIVELVRLVKVKNCGHRIKNKNSEGWTWI